MTADSIFESLQVLIRILTSIGVIAVVIFVHELGHFLVAKWCDVEVRTFSLGFGRTLFARQYGETEYRIAAIPVGGYVRMAGQDDDEDVPPTDPSRGFSAKSLLQRTAIVAAGPAVNFVFAIVVFGAMFLCYGKTVPTEIARLGPIRPGQPAAEAGLEPGDLVTAIDGKPVDKWTELVETVRGSEGHTLAFTIERDGVTQTIDVTPKKMPLRDQLGEVVGQTFMIGAQQELDQRAPVGPFEAAKLGLTYTWGYTTIIFETLARVFQGRIPASDLGGPIMIVQEAYSLAATGFERVLQFVAVISVNLGIINVLPIPVLDGGHLFFFLIEAVRGKPLSVRVRETAMQVGVLLLVTLMVFVFYNDIARNLAG
jgi:regulator of sigma E protease